MKKLLQGKKWVLAAWLLLSSFSFTKAATTSPVITSFSPTSGAVGTTVTINGSNFNTTATNNIVFFGATRATVSSTTATSLTVTVPDGATYQPISVTDISTGLTGYSSAPFITTFDGTSTVNPNSFANRIDFSIDSDPSSVSMGDIDGDGKNDLVVTTSSSAAVSVFRNTGSGDTISFATKVDFTAGSYPESISITDVDGDGKPDVVVGNTNSNSVSILRNNSTEGNISLETRVNLATGNIPKCIAMSDLDGDGKPDIAVTNWKSNTVSVFRNTSTPGAISFDAGIDYTTGNEPFSISLGDLDADGKPDMVVANYSDNNISIFKNTSTTGTISFALPVTYPSGKSPRSVAIADLDADGKPDLVTANGYDYTVSVFRNTTPGGALSFTAKVDYPTGEVPYEVSIGDVNGDGKPDIAVANYSSHTVSVLTNGSTTGSLSFAQKIDYASGYMPYKTAIGDLNNDGKPEIAIASYYSNAISVLRNRILPLPTISSFSPVSATSGDTITIIGTNLAELLSISFGDTSAISFTKISATSCKAIVGSGATGSVSVTNTAGSTSKAGFTYTVPSAPTLSSFAPVSASPGTKITITGTHLSGTTAVTFGGEKAASFTALSDTSLVAVVNNTGASGNLTVTTTGGSTSSAGFTFIPAPTVSSFTPTSGPVGTTVTITGTNFNSAPDNNVVFFGAVQAIVTAATNNSLTVTVPTGATYECLSVTDKKTGLTAFSNQPFVTTFDGSMIFNNNSFDNKIDYATISEPQYVSIKDLDGDGKADIAIENSFRRNISILRNISVTGSVSIAAKVDYPLDSNVSYITPGDLNGDGMPDLVITKNSVHKVTILLNNSTTGNMSFTKIREYTTGGGPSSVAVRDLDGDGKPDLAVSNGFSSTISVFLNTSTVDSVSFAPKVDFATGKDPLKLKIADLDGDGKPDMVVTNRGGSSISILLNGSTTGKLSFAPKVDYSTENSPNCVSIGDVDGDGKPDLAVVNQFSASVSVYRNTCSAGTISFASAVVFKTGTGPFEIILNDLDGDGRPDMAVTNYNDNNVSIYKNTSNVGTVSFLDKVDFTTGEGPVGMSIGDVDGDGKPDLEITNNNGSSISILRSRVMPQPTITSFTPDSATVGDTVTITGTYLAEPMSVSFDTIAARSYTSISDTMLTAVVGEGGTGNVNVTTPGGTASLAGFYYLLPQTITFDSISAQTYGDPDFVLNATASSSLDVIYTISDTAVATLISDTVHIKTAGICTIYASQPGDTTYGAAPQVPRILLVNAKPAEVVGVTAASKVYDGTTMTELTGDSLTGILDTDSVTLITGAGTFSDKNIGTGKTVTATGYALTGPDSCKYNLAQPEGLSADITPAPLTIKADSGQTKIVGEADPVFTYSFPNDSLVEGDSITGALTRAQGETAGNYPIEIGTITAGDNYEITFISADFIIKTATGVADIPASAPELFPNPTKGIVTLNVEEGEVTIMNLAGTILAEKTLSTKKTVDLRRYTPGVYVLILKTKDAVYKYKIIKQ